MKNIKIANISKDKQEFDVLHNYILEKYFKRIIPASMILNILKLRQKYEFTSMLKTLQNFEKILLQNINKINFFSDNQKGTYLTTFLEKSL